MEDPLIMARDTTKTLDIEGSPLKLTLLGLLGIVMTAGCLAIVLGYIPSPGPSSWKWWAVLFGVPFFGACTLIGFWRALVTRGPVVSLSPEGLTDRRIAPVPIPWRAVRGISTWTYKRQNVMVLDVDPAVEARLPLSRMVRLTRSANKRLGADGLCVTASGLKLTYAELLEAATDYARAAKSSGG